MPPKRASDKRKADKTLDGAPRPSKRARHDSEPEIPAKRLPSQSRYPHEYLNDSPISSRTRSRARKRSSPDAENETVITQNTPSRPSKRRRVIGPTKLKRSRDVISNEKALLLPMELHSLILDMFWEPEVDDLRVEILPTIRACTSVCRLWRAAALPHLFRSVKVRSSIELNRLASVLQGDPVIATYIRKIRLRGSQRNEQDHWIYSFPSIFTTPLPSLRTLEIRSVFLVKSQQKDVRAYIDWIHTLSTLPTVRQLNLEFITMSRNAMTSLVCAFPVLTKVWLEHVDLKLTENPAPLVDDLGRMRGKRMTTRSLVDNEGPLVYTMLHSPPLIHHLRVDSFDDGARFPLETIKDWLYPDAVSLNLSILDLMPGIEERSIARLIATVSPSLEVLSIPTQGTEISKFKRAGIDLSKLVKLKTLRIYTWHIDVLELDTAYYLLTLLDAPHLETLCLKIFYDGNENAGFQAIDRYLSTAKFTCLRELIVEIMVHNWEPFGRRRSFIEAQLPLARERGIVKVKDCDLGILPFEEHY